MGEQVRVEGCERFDGTAGGRLRVDWSVLTRARARVRTAGSAGFGHARRVSGGGQGLWVEHMSVGSRIAAGVGMTLWLPLLWAGISSIWSQTDRGGTGMIPIATAAAWFMVAAAFRPVIDARVDGVLVRNIIWEYWVPWEAIDTAAATMRVNVVMVSGQPITCWAVQKTNVAAMTKSRSRTDRVSERLLATRQEQLAVHPAARPPAEVTRRPARIPTRVLVAFGLFVVIAVTVTTTA